jgi:uncharacterized protein (DUF924 family)
MENVDTVLVFWFETLSPADWFKKDEKLDKAITTRFFPIHQQAVSGELSEWRDSAKGALAEVIILDQFSRNIFRDKKEAFAFDGMALALSQVAIDKKQHEALTLKERAFLYMPFMHSESLLIHAKALLLFSEKGLENNLTFEKQHHDIIKRFGRYPHRNAILNRNSTEEEIDFLKTKEAYF